MTEPLEAARIHWKNDKTPASTSFDDVYFSAEDGLAESHFVFLENNHLPQRFSQFNEAPPEASPNAQPFVIAETGFGTGLNFCLCWQLWRKQQRPGKKLLFISSESRPLQVHDLAESLAQWPSLADEARLLTANYPPLIRGIHRIELNDSVSLLLLFNDVVTGFNQLLALPNITSDITSPARLVDAWFLDGFAPAKNPDMWRTEVFHLMAQLSHRQTTVATFTAAGTVKRGLQSAGFEVKKIKGFGRKRNMLQANFLGLPTATIPPTQRFKKKNEPDFWPIYNACKKPRSVTIIGAGIAGSTTALTLSKSGFDVTLIDQTEAPLKGASGNPQAVIFPKFSHKSGILSDFYTYAYFYAMRFYQQHFPYALHKTGMLQLIPSQNAKKLADAKALHQRYHNTGIMELIDPDKASAIAGVDIDYPALYIANAGWLDQDYMRTLLLENRGVTQRYNCTVNSLSYHQHQWQIETTEGKLQSDALILANGHQAEALLTDIDPGLMLSTGNIRGQISQIPRTDLPAIQTILCHEGYLCPLKEGQDHYCLGATYDLNDNTPTITEASQQENLEKLAQAVAGLSRIGNNTFPLAGKVGFRCTTPDYLPIVGPVPNSTDFKQTYGRLGHNKNAFIPALGNYHPSLFLNIGLGSRGFCSAPISAALLLAYLTGQFMPLDNRLIKALHPGRFLIRSIIKNRVI